MVSILWCQSGCSHLSSTGLGRGGEEGEKTRQEKKIFKNLGGAPRIKHENMFASTQTVTNLESKVEAPRGIRPEICHLTLADDT